METFVKWGFVSQERLTEMQNHFVVKQHVGGLFLMAHGKNLWTDIDEPVIVSLCHFAEHRILPLMNSTHCIEEMLRNASLCATTRRNEGM